MNRGVADRYLSRMKRVAALLLLCAFGLFAQANDGELHLKITDPSGLGVKTTVDIRSEANQYHNTLETDEEGKAVAKNLPYGVYRITIREPGFAEVSRKVEVRSSVPTNYEIKLELSPVNAAVTVTEASTLINPDQAGSVSQIGSNAIQDRFTSLPGRSLQDLVNSQPGWLYEGNAVLHPRGSEYQTQFVIDGIPLTDNRSPSLGPEIEADDVQSMTVYTAGIPAEYGRKMGGVIEVNTIPDTQPGFHGQAVLSGGSFDTAGMFGQAQYSWGKNSVAFSADGSMTDHYLNPVVPENLTNTGTTGDFSVDFERDLTAKDHIDLTVRHELARYEIPNEFVQQATGQRQDADNFETMGIASYQHVFSSNAVADVRAMIRENSNDFNSNADSTPVEVFQHNWFREGYFKGTVTIDHGHHEWKFGAESDNMFLNENFRYAITDPTQYDPSTPLTFAFLANRPDLEQSAFVQDLIRLGNWTISAGLRWDHYQLLLNRQGVSPRFSISRYFPSADLMLHFSYDRVFQTPSFENILLSSSTAAANLSTISTAIARRAFGRELLRSGADESLLQEIQAGRQLLPPVLQQLRGRRSDTEHDDQLSDRLPQGGHLRQRCENRFAELEALFGFCQLLVPGRQCVVSGDRRSFSWRQRGDTDDRPFSGLAGSAQQCSRAGSLSDHATFVDRGRDRI